MVLNFNVCQKSRSRNLLICWFCESNRSAKALLSWSRAGSWFRLVDILDLPTQLPLAYSWTNGHSNDFIMCLIHSHARKIHVIGDPINCWGIPFCWHEKDNFQKFTCFEEHRWTWTSKTGPTLQALQYHVYCTYNQLIIIGH